MRKEFNAATNIAISVQAIPRHSLITTRWIIIMTPKAHRPKDADNILKYVNNKATEVRVKLRGKCLFLWIKGLNEHLI